MAQVVLLHPGEMGASIGAALTAAGHQTVWVSSDRTDASRRRAQDAGLVEAPTLETAVAGADVVLCVCPPEFAFPVARAVLDAGFRGIYVDGNAVAPATTLAVAKVVGGTFVDGGIIGPPAGRRDTTRFYLSGDGAHEMAALFDGTVVDARVVDGGIGAASALKMCYAAYTKGSTALLLGVRALAASNGVTGALLAEWDLSQPGLKARSEGAAGVASAKAWRFAEEMREIAATFQAGSLPDGFHQAAAEVYEKLASFKGRATAEIDVVVAALLAP